MSVAGAPFVRSSRRSHWLCCNGFHLRLPDWLVRLLATLLDAANRLLGGRLPYSVWIRYELDLTAPERQLASEAVLSPMDEVTMDWLRAHPWRSQPQLITAFRLWEHGLRRAYVWVEDGQPLCMQWLFLSEDNERLRALPVWSGMYPPLAPHCGQVENIVVLPKGLRRRQGCGVPFSHAMCELARRRGLRRLITHIPLSNVGAQRWAERAGWVAYGTIRRYRLPIPGGKAWFWYLHSSLPSATAPTRSPAVEELAAAEANDAVPPQRQA